MEKKEESKVWRKAQTTGEGAKPGASDPLPLSEIQGISG
jgi:hypothetical protein